MKKNRLADVHGVVNVCQSVFLLIKLCQFSDDNRDQQGQQRQHERTLVQYKCCFRCPCCRLESSGWSTDGEVLPYRQPHRHIFPRGLRPRLRPHYLPTVSGSKDKSRLVQPYRLFPSWDRLRPLRYSPHELFHVGDCCAEPKVAGWKERQSAKA